MKLKKIFLILTALVAFSSTLTAVSDYEYLLGKYRTMKKIAEEERLSAEKRAELIKNAEHIKSIDAYFVKIPNQNYSMMMTEITQKQWQIIMGNNPSRFKGDNLPVEEVSWTDAVVFCNKLSEKEGLKPCYSYDGISNVEKWKFLKEKLWKWSDKKWKKFNESFVCDTTANGYRLPTVEEWQYAAKDGQEFKYSGSDNLDEVGWYDKNSEEKTHPVAQKKPNGYGLYDMSGNVREWCWDSRSGKRYDCGGSWNNNADYCEVGDEDWSDADYTNYNLGFRIVRSSSKK
ncbi:formylglycine-generating enzyme family protein [uncultured Treponema sp.]|uniref:formylglycine-generating enzyme family protein n=1 Tax=uncultured Treponema sp. TaxID=162155 RepID=UPI00259530CF|nr:formylglycine-generating enzyme family protein [uncultured Treponema sp.]